MNAAATNTARPAPRRRLASVGHLLLQGLAGPACQQAMQAHLPQPAGLLQDWMQASIDASEGWSRHTATDRPAHAVHLQGAHA